MLRQTIRIVANFKKIHTMQPKTPIGEKWAFAALLQTHNAVTQQQWHIYQLQICNLNHTNILP